MLAQQFSAVGVLAKIELLHELHVFFASRPHFAGVDDLEALVIGRPFAFCRR